MRAIFFGLLGHQAHVGHRTHGLGVKSAVPLAEVDHLLVDTRKSGLWHHSLHVLEAAIGPPHLATIADHGGHGRVHDHVVGRVEVGDALGRVHHGQFGSVFVAGVKIALDLVLLALGQRGNFFVQIGHAIVDIHTQLFKQLGVLLKRPLVENLDAVAEHDGVRHLHHGCLDVQRKHHACFVRVFNFLFVELQQRPLAHEHAVDHLTVQQRGLGLEQNGFAAFCDEFHLHVARAVQRQRLLTMVEIAIVHM